MKSMRCKQSDKFVMMINKLMLYASGYDFICAKGMDTQGC